MDWNEVTYSYIPGYIGEEIVLMQIETQYTVCPNPNVTIRYLSTDWTFVDVSSGLVWTLSPVLDESI